MDRPDKTQRKALLRAWRENENQNSRALYPLPDQRLEEFFSALETLRSEHGCFHVLRHAFRVIDGMSLSTQDSSALLDWCNALGGYCDCEIAANAFARWSETRRPER